MRIFLLLAAAGAFAIATAAPARPGGKPGGHGGPGGPGGPGVSSPGWSANPGRKGPRTGWSGRPVPKRHGGRGRGHGDALYFYGGGYAPGGIIEPYGDGFFAGGGGEVWMRGDRPHYDYDRSYPYEFAPRRGPGPEWEEESLPGGPGPRCTIEHGVRVCRGR